MPEETVAAKPPKLPSTLTLTEEDLPEVADFQVGKKYRLVLELKVVGMDSPENEESEEPTRARFIVLSAKTMGGKALKALEDRETEEPEEETGHEGTREKIIERIGEKAQES